MNNYYKTKGIKIHCCIHRFLSLKKKCCTDCLKRNKNLFKNLKYKLEKMKWVYVASEKIVKRDNCRGIIDALFKTKDLRKLIIIDWKVTRKNLKKTSMSTEELFSSFNSQINQAVLQLNIYRFLLNSTTHSCNDIEMYIGNIVSNKFRFIKVKALSDEFMERIFKNYENKMCK